MWILVALLVLIGPLPCLAGESYLDRSKVREAVPYGTTIEPRRPDENAAPPSVPGPESGRPGSPTPSSTIPDAGVRGQDRQ